MVKTWRIWILKVFSSYGFRVQIDAKENRVRVRFGKFIEYSLYQFNIGISFCLKRNHWFLLLQLKSSVIEKRQALICDVLYSYICHLSRHNKPKCCVQTDSKNWAVKDILILLCALQFLIAVSSKRSNNHSKTTKTVG